MTIGDAFRREEAAKWLARLRSRSVTNDELSAFAKWRRDPANSAAYQEVERFWESSARLADDPDIARMVAGTEARRGSWRWWRRPLLRWMSLGGALGLAAITAALFILPARPTTYRTNVDERSVARLDDGSLLRLGADTAVAASMDGRERLVRLRRGRASFDVRHDATRPFVVDVGLVTVTALGTRFDVDRDGSRITVNLLAGSVAVRSLTSGREVRLRPGEGVTMRDGDLARLVRVQASNAVLGAERLSFRNTPLGDAVAAMNRYTDRPIVLRSASLRQEPISGDFSTGDVDGFVLAVESIFGAHTIDRLDGS